MISSGIVKMYWVNSNGPVLQVSKKYKAGGNFYRIGSIRQMIMEGIGESCMNFKRFIVGMSIVNI